MAKAIRAKELTWCYFRKYVRGDTCGWGGRVWVANKANQSVEPRYQAKGAAWTNTGTTFSMPSTQKPCPTCGGHWSRNADSICAGCLRRIREAGLTAEKLRKQAEVPSVMVSLQGGDIPYLAGDQEHSGESVREWIVRLAESVAVPLPAGFNPYSIDCEPLVGEMSNHGVRRDCAVHIPKTFHAALAGLWQAIVRVCDRRQKDGMSAGSSLLLGLATGETTIAEFNDATIGVNRNNNEDEDY